MVGNVLPQVPVQEEGFDQLFPLHMEANKTRRKDTALSNLTISVANNKFFGANGAAPIERVYGFNANGVKTSGPAIVTYSSSQPLGIPLFYIAGVITGNPFGILPTAMEVQYVGIQITYDTFLLDIKEPYVRL